MSDIVKFSENEISHLGKLDEYMGEVLNDALQVVSVIAKQGHSGNSLGILEEYTHRLLNRKPLSNLTGEPDEWESCGDNQYQNKRCPSVFKDIDGSGKETFYDVDAYNYTLDGAGPYVGASPRYYITFPYYPEKKITVNFPENSTCIEKYGYILYGPDANYSKIAKNIFLNNPKDWQTYCNLHQIRDDDDNE